MTVPRKVRPPAPLSPHARLCQAGHLGDQARPVKESQLSGCGQWAGRAPVCPQLCWGLGWAGLGWGEAERWVN